MSDYKTSDLAELAVILALSAKPHSKTLHKSCNMVRNAVDDAKIILNNARKLHAIAERECNGYPVIEYRDGKRYEYSQLTEEQQAKLEKDAERCKHKIMDAAADYYLEKRIDGNNGKVFVEFQGDPRGCPVKIAFKYQTWIGG